MKLLRQGTLGGSVLVHHSIWRVCTSAMPCLCYCILWSHICRRRNIAWLLELLIWCCFSKLLSLQSIGVFLSKAIGPVCASTGDVVGPTYFLFLEGWRVDSGISSLLLWCELHDWVYQWWILACLCLFLLKIGMPWCCVPRLSDFIAVGIPVENGSGCPSPDRSCARKSDLILWVCGVRGVHLVSGVRHTAEVWIWCGLSIKLRYWRAPPSVGCHW